VRFLKIAGCITYFITGTAKILYINLSIQYVCMLWTSDHFSQQYAQPHFLAQGLSGWPLSGQWLAVHGQTGHLIGTQKQSITRQWLVHFALILTLNEATQYCPATSGHRSALQPAASSLLLTQGAVKGKGSLSTSLLHIICWGLRSSRLLR
jgi:hypothetical protein